MANTTLDVRVGRVVETEDGFRAFVRRIDAKSDRAVIVFTEDEYVSYETMRKTRTLTPVRGERLITDIKAAVNAARVRAAELDAAEA